MMAWRFPLYEWLGGGDGDASDYMTIVPLDIALLPPVAGVPGSGNDTAECACCIIGADQRLEQL